MSVDYPEPEAQQPFGSTVGHRNITDQYRDLLSYLRPAQRKGLTARLANGYYEGWRPSRDEIADLVGVELGVITWDESVERGRARRAGKEPMSIIGRLRIR